MNPTDRQNIAILNASQYGHADVVRIVLNDHRVNPADHSNHVTSWASKNGHSDVIKR